MGKARMQSMTSVAFKQPVELTLLANSVSLSAACGSLPQPVLSAMAPTNRSGKPVPLFAVRIMSIALAPDESPLRTM